MCPACLATAALVAAGATSAGGLAALVVSRLRAGGASKELKEIDLKARIPGGQDGTTQSGVAG